VTAAERTATVLLTWTALFLTLCLLVITMGCENRDDGTKPSECGELSSDASCDGQS
jgi:hypothetical protein